MGADSWECHRHLAKPQDEWDENCIEGIVLVLPLVTTIRLLLFLVLLLLFVMLVVI
jgi:hypothetical protein